MTDHPIDSMLQRCAAAIADARVTHSIASNAWRHVDELRTNHPLVRDEDLARMAVDRVLAEAKSYPPAGAIRVRVENRASASLTETGIWTEEAMAVILRWVNRADFSIQFKQVAGAISVNDDIMERTFTMEAPAHFELAPRSEHRLELIAVLDRKRPPPRYSQAAVAGEAYVEALVMGPWPESSHQIQRFNAGRAWFPVSPTLVTRASP